MTEETKQSLAAKELDNESKHKDKTAMEHKSLKLSPEHFQNVSLEPQAVNNLAKFAEKERDNTQQREAVIRPQQAGKIDFKSLQNHSFNSNRTWPSGKDSPQSPSGKSRNRDKIKKSGKGDRGNPQQLYRLSNTYPRSNPTIGIAYPQQKVSPPKKIESSRGPVSGSYRFHVPSIPEREAELQQEELQFRCFQEGSPNLTSQSYTSQANGSTSGGSAQQNPPSTPQQQKPSSIETTTTGNENVFPDFQLSETDTWQSPDRTFRNSNFGVTSQKPNNLVDLNKADGSFMPSPFQYGYPLLEASASDSFTCNQNNQSHDYIDISLTPNQVSNNSFTFQSSAESHKVMQTSTQFGNDQTEDKQSYTSHSKPPQFTQTGHGVPPSVPSNEESSVSRIHQSELTKSVQDKSDSFNPADIQDIGLAVGGKAACHHKNASTSQRVLVQGLHHIRNIAQGPSSQVHVISPPHHGIQIGSMGLDKGVSKHHSRVSHQWEGPNKSFQPPHIDHTPTPYPFQYQPSPEQKQNNGISGRMPWQQICYTTAMPNQNRIDLTRQLSNQQLTFLTGTSDWQDDSKPNINSNQKSSNNIINKTTNEGFPHQRQDNVKQGCNTIPPSHFTNKVETNQSQVGDAKNKSLYFGINHSGPVTSSRTCSYPPSHVAPVGLRMVSPYDSPTHSPTQNTTPSSTCSSLSPASTNSINSNSEDSQIPKVLSPQFYQQQQDKALISSNILNTSQHHYPSEASRGLHYKQERTKDNILGFIPNNRHSNANMDNAKGCLDTYRTEHPPPPQYSAHQLSLATANLDQLDVLLTCKQCDQNFNNLASFLNHKEYCGQHTFAQNDLKDLPKVEDIRKFQTDHTKAVSSGSSYAILRSSSDLHLSLLGLNKNGEIVPDNETKADRKDEPMKLMLPSAPLPDLEMEDPKLDSLITEALNGLGYQSDNADIDSSFIDAFVDDDLTTTKCTSTRQGLTIKDSTVFDGRIINELTTKSHDKYPFDSDLDSLSSDKQTNKHQHESVQNKETSPKECQSQESLKLIEWETKKSEKKEQENDYGSKFLLSSKFSARCGLNSLKNSTSLVKTTCPRSTSVTKSSSTLKPIATEGKRKRSGGGSWSKELIHKIVQQKNKLHKLHVKGTKNMQFSLVMERVTPAVQTPTFQEYDYVSDSDEDCEPVKIASQGRLSQSIRCKYTYTKECKGRIRADKSRESSWKQNQNECFEAKKALDTSPSLMQESPGQQRLRRRSSRSSTSSELSTSISICSDSMSSPKSIDHTDSDSEKRMETHRKDQESLHQNGYEDSPPMIRTESSTSLALTFTKNTKRYSTDKILLTEHKDSFTTSKCSSIFCKTEETATERTKTKSTVSLARFKTTRVEIEEKEDHYGFETGALSTREDPFKKDYTTESTNNRESNHVFKLKKDVSPKGKAHKKRTNSPKSSGTILEKSSNDNPPSEEAKGSSSHPFSEPPPVSSSPMDKICLSPSKIHNVSQQKDGPCLMPYPSDHDPSLIKSPLSFDTTSMFGDLSVGGFENNLYPDIQLAKESFSPSETTVDKKELFESSFSPFLEQRDWNLMVDVTPVLPDEISQYKDESDSNGDKTNFNHVPFSLPEKLMDYNQNLNSTVSVDDLEIKRIVTELESQLQTAKLSSPPPLNSELPKQLTMSKFSPLRLDPESEDEDSSLEMNSDKLPIDPPVESHSALFTDPDLPWTSPLQFGIMCGQQGLHTPTHNSTINTPVDSDHDDLDLKDSTRLSDSKTENCSSMHLEDINEENMFLYLSTNKSEEMLEQKMYTENLIKSLEVISDSLSSGFTSPHLSPNRDCRVLEEQEKQNSEHSECTYESEKVKSTSLKPDVTELSVNTNIFSGQIDELTTIETAGTKSENAIKESLDDSNATLHIEELVVNEQQLSEGSFKSLQNKSFEGSSNEIDPEVSIYKHNDCDSLVGQTEKAESEINFDVKDSINFTHRLLLNKTATFSTYKAISKDNNIMCVEGHKYDAKESNRALEPISEENEHTSDIKEGATDNPYEMCNLVALSSIESPSSENQLSTHSKHSGIPEMNSQQVPPPKEHSMVHNYHDRTGSVQEATTDISLFPAKSECEENQQKIPPTKSPQFSSNSVQSPSELRDNSILPGGLNDDSTVTTANSGNRPALEDKNSKGINTGRSVDTFDSPETGFDNSFIPLLDLVEIPERNMSSPRKLLAKDSISEQASSETPEHSEELDGSQEKSLLYDLKLSPLNYTETCFNDYNFTSKCLNKDDEEYDIKSSSKDNFIIDACALSLEKTLTSSPPPNPSEIEPTIQDHLARLDIPDISIKDNMNHNVKYLSIPTSCSSFIEEVTPLDSVQFTKLNQNELNGCHVPLETGNFMNMHLSLVKKTDSEKLENLMIPTRHDLLLRSTVLDKDIKPMSIDLTCPSVHQSLKQREIKTSPKTGSPHIAVQGKFQCEICAMFFRTLPGLKRHKAMKHMVKTGRVSTTVNLNMSSQVFVPIYHEPQPMERAPKERMDIMDPAAFLNPKMDEIAVVQGQQVQSPLMFEGTGDAGMSNPLVKYDLNQTTVVNAKANNNKTAKNNNMDISNELFAPKMEKQDSFSDEILNMLKADILQAITPNFPSLIRQNCPTLPEKQDLNNSQSYQEVIVSQEKKDMETVSTKEQKDKSTKGVGHDDDVVSTYRDVNPTYVQTEAVHSPADDSSIDIKCENTCYPKDSHTLIGTSGLEPDLNNFYDDECTFSQLFPRSDDRKRKRCARVYGKSNKKQKQLSCLVLDYPPTNVFMDKCEESQEKTISQMFANDTHDHCEFETISVDDANMLDMCHKSSVQSSTEIACASKDELIDHPTGYEENAETGIREFLCEAEGTITQPIVSHDEFQGTDKESTVSSVSQQDCKPEVSSTASSYDLVCVQENDSHSPSIEISNNATIKPVPFFEPGTDMPLVEPIASTELIDPVRPDKNPIERKCRKRIEPGLKPKDKQYKCKVCFTWFLTLGELDFHKLSHNPSPPPTCYMCVQRKFSSREQLRDHLREKHAKNKAGVWTCGMCLKEISDVWMYNEHLREHATQFARRGQSQSSLLDMPGCFMQENAVKNFISSIMQHRPSRPTKSDNFKQSKAERKSSLDGKSHEPNSTEEFDSTALKNKNNIEGGKQCALTTLEVLPKAETSSKNAEMHPNCKDPSRDCHHCGKQFPKPFKLQRHLVVHSLQKIFLCHKCPVSYQEAKELKDHLKNEHEDADEPDSKHTTLYTCELCADVMHVIKKSFICSTCNYTFSKKEQFDRHMEKHLAGGNKIFKFRGVVRPRKPFTSNDDKSEMPPSKKMKATDSNSDNAVDDTLSLNLNESMQGIKSVPNIIDDTALSSFDEHSTDANTSVKIEDIAEDFLIVARSITQCLVQNDSTEQTLSTTEVKEEDNNCSQPQASETSKVITIDKEALTEICDVKIEDDCCTIPTTLLVSENHISESNIKYSRENVEKNESVILENASEQTEMQDPSLFTIPVCSQLNILPNQDIQGLSSCIGFDLSSVRQSSSETNQLNQDLTFKESFSLKINENKQDANTTPYNEKTTSGSFKHITSVRSVDNPKQSFENNPRCLSSTDAGLSNSRPTNIGHSSTTGEDKDTKQKKRKDLKTPHSSHRIPSPTARENLGIDLRVKKKLRLNRCENIDGQRKSDLHNDYPVLTSVKDDTVSNKIVTKNKIGSSNVGLQLKKSSVDSFSPKKVDIVRHFNGDYKGKKSVPGKTIHSPSSRMSSMNNSANKSRPKPGVRSIETQSYRTAESQNNLLNQLFGQRLTSFKIPLRKDNSESIS
ncbi:Zinc finger protein 469 [Triplophysa tibetana]|uniref:Zinc finger protein 469 n=1 Tax=Triplophysa tibetana TaxID=1572043 RepID=A0A5A9PQQ1_9TELE|nr:Zinc finger protein 469 [Triplophysa tibetana]